MMNDVQHVLPIATGFYDPTNDIHKEQGHIRKNATTHKRKVGSGFYNGY